MYCPECGKELPDDVSFCPGCGQSVGNAASGHSQPAYSAQGYAPNTVPKTPSTIVPFLLGFILGIFGVIIAVLVYNGNDGPYTKNPTTHALMWSLVGMLIWIPIMIMVVLSLMAAL